MTAILVLTAALLGGLAFFEPCTIATHTLFSARAHSQPRAGCCRKLLAVWLARSVLCVVLLARHQKVLEVVAGVTLIITGLYLLNEYFFIIKY